MNTPAKIQIDSSLSALAKAHQELLAIYVDGATKSTERRDSRDGRQDSEKRSPSKASRKRD